MQFDGTSRSAQVLRCAQDDNMRVGWQSARDDKAGPTETF